MIFQPCNDFRYLEVLGNILRITMSFECGISTPKSPEIHNTVISAVFSKGKVTKKKVPIGVEITHFDPIFIPLLTNQKI